MDRGIEILLTALALVLIMEGAAYALFPDGLKRMMAVVQEVPSSTLRALGMAVAVTGLIIVWLIRG
jgi:uncharacterized protein YjeT (DUF2065 family)